MGNSVEIVKELVSPINKLIDITAKGVGKIFEPVHLKRMYKARAEGIKLLNDTIKETDLGIQIDDSNMKINNEEITARAINRLSYQELLKQKNIENVLGLTYEEIKNEDNVINTPVEENWIIRFFNTVQDITNEDLQKIWAKLLSGEIRKPGSISLRTMEVLKNLSSEEAQLFELYSKYAVCSEENVFIPIKMIDNKHLYFNQIMLLDDCGLINSSEKSCYFCENNVTDTVSNSQKIITITKVANKSYYLSVFAFTTSGNELYKLLNIKSEDITLNNIKNDILMNSLAISEKDIGE